MSLCDLEVDLIAKAEVQRVKVPLEQIEFPETEAIVRADFRQEDFLPKDFGLLAHSKDQVHEVKDPLIDPGAHRLCQLLFLLLDLLLLFLQVLQLLLLFCTVGMRRLLIS